jgi:hydroxypyruvate isomerase
MPRLAANVSTLFPEAEFLDRFALADVPGRNEPGTGEINFDFLLGHLDRIGYAGWVGCEYNPLGDTVEGLKWAKRWL